MDAFPDHTASVGDILRATHQGYRAYVRDYSGAVLVTLMVGLVFGAPALLWPSVESVTGLLLYLCSSAIATAARLSIRRVYALDPSSNCWVYAGARIKDGVVGVLIAAWVLAMAVVLGIGLLLAGVCACLIVPPCLTIPVGLASSSSSSQADSVFIGAVLVWMLLLLHRCRRWLFVPQRYTAQLDDHVPPPPDHAVCQVHPWETTLLFGGVIALWIGIPVGILGVAIAGDFHLHVQHILLIASIVCLVLFGIIPYGTTFTTFYGYRRSI